MTFARLKPTQNERILALLADGRWHTTREILANVPCIVHSRIAEINAKPGYLIEHDGAGGGAEKHRYRLTATAASRAHQRYRGDSSAYLDCIAALCSGRRPAHA
jgi:hypothetical protein